MSRLVRVANVTDVAPGSGMVARVDGKEFAVFNVNGTYSVIDNRCLHRGGPLGEGDLEGDVVTCPWHGWEYNVKTGECLTQLGVKVGCYEVSVEDGAIMLKDPSNP